MDESILDFWLGLDLFLVIAAAFLNLDVKQIANQYRKGIFLHFEISEEKHWVATTMRSP